MAEEGSGTVVALMEAGATVKANLATQVRAANAEHKSE